MIRSWTQATEFRLILVLARRSADRIINVTAEFKNAWSHTSIPHQDSNLQPFGL
jgi:hypothetical protein